MPAHYYSVASVVGRPNLGRLRYLTHLTAVAELLLHLNAIRGHLATRWPCADLASKPVEYQATRSLASGDARKQVRAGPSLPDSLQAQIALYVMSQSLVHRRLYILLSLDEKGARKSYYVLAAAKAEPTKSTALPRQACPVFTPHSRQPVPV